MKEHLFDLTGQVAIVTGTSRGLGQYFGRALARAGADLVITSRDPSTLQAFQKEIEDLGRRVLPLTCVTMTAFNKWRERPSLIMARLTSW
jgi:short-subunit dehydrogenase